MIKQNMTVVLNFIGLLAVVALSWWSYFYLPRSIGLVVFIVASVVAVVLTVFWIGVKERRESLKKAWKAVFDFFWGI
jgi:membrane protein implicated in regulation of membrane protease activity